MNLQNLSLQEIFDQCKAHLLRQGRPARGSDGTCRYRMACGGTQLQCAVGHFIPDHKYLSDLENKSLRGWTPMEVAYILGINVEDKKFRLLAGLQNVHDLCRENADGTFDLLDLNRRLQSLANIWDLQNSSSD